MNKNNIAVVIPAAGVGKRMQSEVPKQYLPLNGTPILEHSVRIFANNPAITQIVVAVSADDEYIEELALAQKYNVTLVIGGNERADSVLAGIKAVSAEYDWVMVHDAARPCLTQDDLNALINTCLAQECAGILASPVRDTMKRANQNGVHTVERENLWHALTPQLAPRNLLLTALNRAIEQQQVITDEASALELAGHAYQLVSGSSNNVKITQPDDLALAGFFLSQQQRQHT